LPNRSTLEPALAVEDTCRESLAHELNAWEIEDARGDVSTCRHIFSVPTRSVARAMFSRRRNVAGSPAIRRGGARIPECRRAHLHRAGSGDEELGGIFAASDPAQPDDRVLHGARRLVDQAQGDGLDGRTGKPAEAGLAAYRGRSGCLDGRAVRASFRILLYLKTFCAEGLSRRFPLTFKGNFSVDGQ
jgi:hypothetical protein